MKEFRPWTGKPPQSKSREGSQLSGPRSGVDAKVGIVAFSNHPNQARRLSRVNEVAVGASALQKLHAPSISVCSVGVVVAHDVIKDVIRVLRVGANDVEVLAAVVGDGDLAALPGWLPAGGGGLLGATDNLRVARTV
jgi:hypothetical protein